MTDTLSLDEMLRAAEKVKTWGFGSSEMEFPTVLYIGTHYSITLHAHEEKRGEDLVARPVHKGVIKVEAKVRGKNLLCDAYNLLLGTYIDREYDGKVWQLYSGIIEENRRKKAELYEGALAKFRKQL